jgi:hypothetical protein
MHVNEDTIYNEMMVSVNGPSPAQCDKVVMADNYETTFQRAAWHSLCKKSNDISLFDTVGVSNNSKVVNRMLQEKSRLPFMQ